MTPVVARAFERIRLKGAALLLDGADVRPCRTMSDIDLLIPEASASEIERVLTSDGYWLAETSWKHQRYSSTDPAAPLILGDGEHLDNPHDVEVHQSVVEMFHGFRWDLTPSITNRPESHERVDRPTPEAMALHLDVHCSLSLLDGTGRAIQLIDLARALREAEPGSVVADVQQARMRRYARFAYPALALTARERGEPIANEAAETLRPFIPSAMVAWIESRRCSTSRGRGEPVTGCWSDMPSGH